MRPEYEVKLYKTAPNLLKNCFDCDKNLVNIFGIECGDGWYAPLRRFFVALDGFCTAYGIELVLYQIKEKLSDIVVYWGFSDSTIARLSQERKKMITDAIVQLEKLLRHDCRGTCEICGTRAVATTKGYMRRVCKDCLPEKERDFDTDK